MVCVQMPLTTLCIYTRPRGKPHPRPPPPADDKFAGRRAVAPVTIGSTGRLSGRLRVQVLRLGH